MARAALTPVALGGVGALLQDVDAVAELTDGNSFRWKRGRHLYVANGDDASLVVTIPTPGTVGPQALALADATFTIPAGKDLLFPELGQEYRQSDGTVHVNYAGTTPTLITAAALDMA